MSSTDRIAAHHKKWDALPPFPDYPYVMQDDDVESWSDLLYLRALCDELEDKAHKLAADPIGVHQVAMARLCNAADLVHVATALMPVPAAVSEPWPVDRAAGMLAAWRLARGPRTPQLALTAAVAA